eukprot:Skav216179  [mRNA]  locus=scaffold2249:111271:123568:+ [translate_table: standard]
MQRLQNLASEALTWPHLGDRQRLVWAAAAELDAVPLQERNLHRLPGPAEFGRLPRGLLLELIGFLQGSEALPASRAVYGGHEQPQITQEGRLTQILCQLLMTMVVNTSAICEGQWGRTAAAAVSARLPGGMRQGRSCHRDGVWQREDAGDQRVGVQHIRQSDFGFDSVFDFVLITVPLRALLDQFAPDFPGFCKVGMGHNKKINLYARGFIAVTDSVHLLKTVKFDSIFVDEGHHPLPANLPKTTELYQFSATHKDEPEFRYTLGKAIEDGVLCDYDITVPALTAHHAYVCLADLLVKQAGRFRRVLAYCNSVNEAKRFRMVLKELGLAAWHINAKTPLKRRTAAIEEFASALQKPVHVLVTVEVLGEGINIPNADTCMFVEPRNSYRSIIQAIGRVLRHHPAKTLAHIVLPAVAIPSSKVSSMSLTEGQGKVSEEEGQRNAGEIPNSRSVSKSRAESRGETFEQDRQQNVRESVGVRLPLRKRSLETHEEIHLQSPDAMIQVRERQLQERNSMRTSARTDYSRVNPTSDFQVEEVRGGCRPNNDVVGKLEAVRNCSVVPLTITKNGWAHTHGQHYRDSRRKPEVLVAESHEMHADESKSGAIGVSQGHWMSSVGRAGSDISPGTTAESPTMVDQGVEPHSKQPKPLQGKVGKQMGGQPAFGTVGSEEKIALSQHVEPLCPGPSQLVQSQEPCHQHPAPAWTSPNPVEEEQPLDISRGGTTSRPKLSAQWMKVPSGSLAFDEGFGSQLERFLATLMQADHRLVEGSATHRIQIVDCTLADGGATMMERWTAEIYGQLSMILSREDPWEVRLRNLEVFVKENGKLPDAKALDYRERTLGYWVQDQGVAFRTRRMPLHRYHQLRASSPLIRRRAERWQAGDIDGRFREKCRKLREHLELHGSLPKQSASSSAALGRWLAQMARSFRVLRPDEKKILQEMGPLVKTEVEKWQNQKVRIKRPRWERHLGELSEFVSGTNRIPIAAPRTGGEDERRCYNWLQAQHRYLRAGILPSDLVQKLREAHPLIAEYLNGAGEPVDTVDNHMLNTILAQSCLSQRCFERNLQVRRCAQTPRTADEEQRTKSTAIRCRRWAVSCCRAADGKGSILCSFWERLDDRDAAFMQRLRNLATEALTWQHLGDRQRLVWAVAAELDAVPLQERNLIWPRPAEFGWFPCCSLLELLGFLQRSEALPANRQAEKCTVVTSSHRLPKNIQAWLRNSGAEHSVITRGVMKRLAVADLFQAADEDGGEQPLLSGGMRQRCSGHRDGVLLTVPLRALLDQFAPNFAGFCKVGMGHNKRIRFDATGFIAVTDSVHLLKKLKFESIFVDEAHHPLPSKLPQSTELYRFSATQKDEPDFKYSMGQAIEDGVLCDYDITVPALTAHHAYVCLADLLIKQTGRFRRVLAYCNTVSEAKRFRKVLTKLGLAAWHINSRTPWKKRTAVIEEFAGALQKPVHVLVTVEVLGEGINIPNADTCMFVEPRNSYRSIVQAIGRVLRHHPAKTLAHIVLPAVAIPNRKSASESCAEVGETMEEEEGKGRQDAGEIPKSRSVPKSSRTIQVQGLQQKQDEMRNAVLDVQVVHGHTTLQRNEPPMGTSLAVPQASSKSGWTHTDGRHYRDSSRKPEILGARMQKGLNYHFGAVGTEIEPTARPSAPVVGRGSEPRPNQLNLRFQQKLPTLIQRGTEIPGCEEELPYSQGLETLDPSSCEPVQRERLAPQHPFPSWSPSSETEEHRPSDIISRGGTTLWPKFRRSLKMKVPSGSPAFDQGFPSQLERFLATLMQADHRLVRASADHRIQIADCTFADHGGATMEEWTAEIYGRLSVILSQEDPWEVRLRNLEVFVRKHGRLPRKAADDSHENTLGTWLGNQQITFRQRRMPQHRFRQLLAASPLIHRRAAGWQTGDADGHFEERCQELREHMQLHRSLPTHSGSASTQLAWWMNNLQASFGILPPYKKKLLQEVHPLIKAEVEKWQTTTPPQMKLPQWKSRLDELSKFVYALDRLPKSVSDVCTEQRLYQWLWRRCRDILAGRLSLDMQQQLRDAHPLIATYLDAAYRRQRSRGSGTA